MDGYWGTICDENWNTTEAGVVCRQLGFDGEFRVLPTGTFKEGSGPIHLSQVYCNGNETNFLECKYETNNNCHHRNDAGVDYGGLSLSSIEKDGTYLDDSLFTTL
ncbi:Galectin-3-binding protein A [Holothuria leucospilota]|uniref:Galectin-3-binding protein A n=1 Tax=Holothuria leucospilota TaxID=206669 RepID=A0A9Q1HG10_HOLLE|nr:Galectin-3-binding protein A [Holothuria leucospilota]